MISTGMTVENARFFGAAKVGACTQAERIFSIKWESFSCGDV